MRKVNFKNMAAIWSCSKSLGFSIKS